MTYLTYIAMFGAAVTVFLWLRDARIFFRTGLPGYRKAAYHGVVYGALATLGVMLTVSTAGTSWPRPDPWCIVPAGEDRTREGVGT